jgi:hypothetical protein
MNSDNKIKRTSRASEEKKPKRSAPWMPSSSLDAPPAPEGYVHRWIRVSTMGQDDTRNVTRKQREGWEFVRAEEIKNDLGDHDYPIIQQGKNAGLIGHDDLVLARIPIEIVEQRKEYFARMTQDRMKAVDSDLMREQRPEMPINIERQSRVTFGGGAKK